MAFQELVCERINKGKKVIGQLSLAPNFAFQFHHLQPEDEAPDLIVIDSLSLPLQMNLQEMANNASLNLVDLTSFVLKEVVDVVEGKDGMLPMLKSQFTHRGRWYGVPWINDYRILMYNRSTLQELNLLLPPPAASGLPESEWTWSKFIEYLRIIQREKNVWKIF